MSGYNGQKESLHSLMKRSFYSSNATRIDFFHENKYLLS